MPNEEQHLPTGPERVLGELEAAIMQVVWTFGEVTVRAVQEALQPTRALAYTTVMTVMSRLARKGVLLSRKQGKTYYYQAAQPTPDAYMAQRVQQSVQKLIASYGDVAIAQFLHALDGVDSERLDALRTLISQESSHET